MCTQNLNMKTILTLFLIGLSFLTYGKKNKGPRFDIADFNSKIEVAKWLCEYDMIAWWTSDSVINQAPEDIERLGNEWFCFKKDGIWHAVYGKYENDLFDQVFHFEVKGKDKVDLITESIDTALTHKYSRALQTANSQLKTLRDTISLRFNQYIRENEDQTISVWILPAFQPNGVAVYGGEFLYTIDPTGTRILNDNSYFRGTFLGFKTDQSQAIQLDYTETEKPTLGAVFFTWYYKNYFSEIIINNSLSISTPLKSGQSWTWIHGEKSPAIKTKSKSKTP